MSVTTLSPRTEVPAVTFDLYRDVHKGIRSELFALTEEAGRLDPGDAGDRAALAGHVHAVVELLVSHAQHEDIIQPAVEAHLPALAAQIASDHETLEGRLESITASANSTTDRSIKHPRQQLHHLYLELASFTAAYLQHQELEERVVMPALQAAVGLDAVVDMHHAVVASIPQDRLTRFLAVMLPAMNIEDRTELLGGLQGSAPAEVFRESWSLARSVLSAADHAALASRLDIRDPTSPSGWLRPLSSERNPR